MKCIIGVTAAENRLICQTGMCEALRFLLLIAFESHRYVTNIWSIDIKLLSIICYPTSLSSMLTASVTLMSSLADVCIQPAKRINKSCLG